MDEKTTRRPRFSLILSYYDQPKMLARQSEVLAAWSEDIRSLWELIVVDDASPNYPAHVGDIGMEARTFRIEKDVRWNWTGARNVGIKESRGEWLLITDIDHVVPFVTAAGLAGMELEDTVYGFKRRMRREIHHAHPNTFLVKRTRLSRIGWFDERLAGLYGGDNEWRSRAGQIERLPLYLDLMTPDDVPDAWIDDERATPANTAMRKQVLRYIAENPGPRTLRNPYHRVQ